MPTDADLEERAIWKLEQAGYAVTIHPGHGYIVTTPNGHAIATPPALDALRALPIKAGIRKQSLAYKRT